MKTTLELPDELYRKAKATAALSGETLTALFTQALESVVSGRSPSVKGASKRVSNPAGEERIRKWRDEEAEFLVLMRGRDHERRSAAEIIGDRRR